MNKKNFHLITEERTQSCFSARSFILEHQENLFFLVDYFRVRLNTGASFYGNADTEPVKSQSHIYGCSSCERWLNNEVPRKYTARPFAMAHYCCSGMYVAVEENEQCMNSIVKFDEFATSDGGQWRIGNLFISYCPWCGIRLPYKSFRDC
ncbi:hypothetical protein ONV78_26275 [Hahella sp. CR1]|uniref:hypothetical protein n=1 Tax=Hahella sp. CR1 TaxID=2992807 RepID=UPI00244356C8|nr:hypothetical protein [Hahella sp. CR1]MDG9671268.1 hypothetical protein [Hahella sp. CR1]